MPARVDTSGSTAIKIHSSSARVDADLVPCFDYRYYFSSGGSRVGTKVIPKTGRGFENYAAQHLEQGRAKNTATSRRFKSAVRILKRVENLMVLAGTHGEVSSYFVECLVFNCPNTILTCTTWVETIQGVLSHIYNELEGTEPSDEDSRWLELNRVKFLVHFEQDWSRADGRDFAEAAWNYLELG